MLRTRNNTDGNKLVIFSGIALYYGDNYITRLLPCFVLELNEPGEETDVACSPVTLQLFPLVDSMLLPMIHSVLL